VILLDGLKLAAARAGGLHARASQVTRARGRAPTLVLIAFGRDGAAPWLNRKLSACAAAGVHTVPLIIPPRIRPADAAAMMGETLRRADADAVFLQFPFPSDFDERPLIDMIPDNLDVDVMTPSCVQEYFANVSALPPVTVTAAIEMFSAYDVVLRDRPGIVVADDSPFASMFAKALSRAGAKMSPLVSPRAPDLVEQLRGAQLVIAAAGRPKLINAADIGHGAAVIDAGYFNPRGIGDIDATSGVGHLDAYGPVPGGIGPMTVSALIERSIRFSESARLR
jgi:methylenetetrahydrofolate dehydrogenase (NADP+) / methenyltetrahydrofolate cyclohydrolase